MALNLRAYQRDAVAAIRQDWQKLDAVLLVAAMGAGKTIMFLELLDQVLDGTGSRGLILAHREELINQPVERIAEFWPHRAPHTGIVMAESDQADRQIVVATVQTLAQPRRLQTILRYGRIDYLVVDEAHHTTAATYVRVIEGLRAANPQLRILGVTATPIRADHDGLSKVYQKVSAKYGIKELIELRHLVPFKALAVQTGVSLKFVKEHDGDFAQKQLADVWECDNVFDLVVESHKRWADGRPTIAFTVTVEGAYRLAEKFREAGISAAAADGATAKADRRGLLDRFRRGEVDVLCNVGIWTEGLDLPRISCAHMVRPTRSDGLYCQCVGRALRTHPGKDDALILDYAPVEARNIVMAGDLLGKPRKQRKLEEQAEKAGVVLSGFSFTGEGTGIDGDPDELVARPLHYLAESPYRWFFHDGVSSLGLGKDDRGISRTLLILPREGKYELVGIARKQGDLFDTIKVLGQDEDFGALAQQGVEIAERRGTPVIMSRGGSWQSNAASGPQVEMLVRHAGLGRERASLLTKGEAAQLLTHAFAVRSLQRAGWAVSVRPLAQARQVAS